jgi:hypothetical protein
MAELLFAGVVAVALQGVLNKGTVEYEFGKVGAAQ